LRIYALSSVLSRSFIQQYHPQEHGGTDNASKPVGLENGKTQHCVAMEAGFSIFLLAAIGNEVSSAGWTKWCAGGQ